MRLFLIRHGESTNNLMYSSGVGERHHDPELTDRGVQQAQRLSEHIARYREHYNFTHLYVSPMIRALQTVQPTAHAIDMTPEVWIDIHEGGGIFLTDEAEDVTRGFPGLTRTELEARFPGYRLPDGITEHGWWDPERGEETYPDFCSRAVRVAISLRERTRTDEVIALFAHAGFLDALIRALFNGLPSLSPRLRYHHRNTGVSRLIFHDDGEISVNYLNAVPHLPPELLSW